MGVSVHSLVRRVQAQARVYRDWTDAALRAHTDVLRSRLADGANLVKLLPAAFACVVVASERTLGLSPFAVQIQGGVELARQRIVETTSEGDDIKGRVDKLELIQLILLNYLRDFGAEVVIEDRTEGGRIITLTGQPELTGHDIIVPGDFSSAAFPMVAALLVPSSRVELTGVGLNPLRTGLLQTLVEMGAAITIGNKRPEGGEPVGDLTVQTSALKGITVAADRNGHRNNSYGVGHPAVPPGLMIGLYTPSSATELYT